MTRYISTTKIKHGSDELDDLLQDYELVSLTDVNVTPGAGVDGYIIYYNDTSSKFELKESTSGVSNFVSLTDVNITTGAGVDEYIVYYDHGSAKFMLKEDAGGVSTLVELTDVNGAVEENKILLGNDSSSTDWIAFNLENLVNFSTTLGAGVDGYNVTYNHTGPDFILSENSFLNLSDSPASFISHKAAMVKQDGSGIEFVTPTVYQEVKTDITTITFNGTNTFTGSAGAFNAIVGEKGIKVMFTDGVNIEAGTIDGNASSTSFTTMEDLSGTSLSTTADAITVTPAEWTVLAKCLHEDSQLELSPAGVLTRTTDRKPLASDFSDLGDVDSYSGQASKIVAVRDNETGLEFIAQPMDTSTFLGLTDTPADTTGADGRVLTVDESGDEIVFTDLSIPSTLLDLIDTPSSFTSTGQLLSINAGNDGLDFVANTFLAQTDTPNSFVGEDGKVLAVNEAGSEIVFSSLSIPTTLLGLTDTPVSFGTEGQVLVVNGSENGLDFVSPEFMTLSDIPDFSGVAGAVLGVNESENGLELFNGGNLTASQSFGLALTKTINLAGMVISIVVTDTEYSEGGYSEYHLVLLDEHATEVPLQTPIIHIDEDTPSAGNKTLTLEYENGSGVQTYSNSDGIKLSCTTQQNLLTNSNDEPLLALAPTGELVDREFKTIRGVDTILDLSDTPEDFMGKAAQLVVVNDSEDGLEFVNNIPTRQKFDASISGTTSDDGTNITMDISDGHGNFDSYEIGFLTTIANGSLIDYTSIINKVDNANGTHKLTFAVEVGSSNVGSGNVANIYSAQEIDIALDGYGQKVLKISQSGELVNASDEGYLTSLSLENLENVNINSPDLAHDQYPLVWDNDSSKYVLAEPTPYNNLVWYTQENTAGYYFLATASTGIIIDPDSGGGLGSTYHVGSPILLYHATSAQTCITEVVEIINTNSIKVNTVSLPNDWSDSDVLILFHLNLIGSSCIVLDTSTVSTVYLPNHVNLSMGTKFEIMTFGSTQDLTVYPYPGATIEGDNSVVLAVDYSNNVLESATFTYINNMWIRDTIPSGGSLTTTNIDKEISITTGWTDVEISGSDLSTGSYTMQLKVGNEYFTGNMSWYSGATEDTDGKSTEISLHQCGNSMDNTVYLRVLNPDGTGVNKIQISADTTISSLIINFKFAKII